MPSVATTSGPRAAAAALQLPASASAAPGTKDPAAVTAKTKPGTPVKGKATAKVPATTTAKVPATTTAKGSGVSGAPRVVGGGPQELDQLLASTVEALNQLQRAATRVTSPALASASAKIELATRTLKAGTASLGDALGELMRLQNEQTTQRSEDARGQIKSNLKQQQAQTRRQIDEIAKRARAASKSSFWGKLVTVLKTVAAAVTIAAGALSGNPLLVAGAALMLASLATSALSDSSEAKWTALGLGLAGAALSGGAGFLGSSAGGMSSLTKLVGDGATQGMKLANVLAPGLANATASAFQAPQGLADRDAAEAETGLAELRAWAQRLFQSSDDEREVLRTVMEAQTRAVALIVQSLDIDEHATAAAVTGAR